MAAYWRAAMEVMAEAITNKVERVAIYQQFLFLISLKLRIGFPWGETGRQLSCSPSNAGLESGHRLRSRAARLAQLAPVRHGSP
jgi:hypothetical protein